MIYLTGDTHGDFRRIAQFCARMNTQPTDIMIILGDAGTGKSSTVKAVANALWEEGLRIVISAS